MTLICDTGVVYAGLVRRDHAHDACAALLSNRDDVVIPAPVLVEIDWLGRSRGARAVTGLVLRSVADGSVQIADLETADYRRVAEILDQYADLLLEYVDAAVVAIAERLEQTVIATLDRRHFSAVKPAHCEAFTLVP